ncbi:MAG: V-type ATP synthase subunit D [Magnetococcales bacterium]|nr:V-type ATP synthase subunit D [Magnetococcales bacterium]
MEITPTRSALLESRDERKVMAEGYRFLDEKRLLLAAEIVKLAARYQQLEQVFLAQQRQSVTSLEQAVARHGFHGVQLLPAHDRNGAQLQRSERLFFGVPLVEEVTLQLGEEQATPAPVRPSPEARSCRQSFTQLLLLTAELAALSGNLQRLLAEYQRTERRARALEDVILPELDGAIHEMDLRLEEMEQEEAIRVRLGGSR